MKVDDVLINNEQSVIGAILIDNDSFDSIDLKAEDFFVESHKIIFSAASEMLESGKVVDLITLAENLEGKSLLDQVGQLKYIGKIVESCSTSNNIKHHASLIRDASRLRKIKAMAAGLIESVDGKLSVDEIIEQTEAGLLSLACDDSEKSISHIHDAVVEAVEYEDTDQKGLMSGLRDLDRHTNGFKDGDLIVIAGRPSMGKTALAMQIAEHVSSHKHVLTFSLEMPKRQLASRMLNFHADRIGKSQAIAHLKSLNLRIDDKSGVTLSHIRSQCRRVKRQNGLDMVVIDYLQLMQGKGENRTQEIGSISRGLKGLAKDFDIPVILLSQLNRSLEQRADRRPVMSDLRESGEIEQDADLILFIYRDEVYNANSEDKGLAEIICRKNRNGAIGTQFVGFNGAMTRFADFNGERVQKVEKPNKREFKVYGVN